MSHVSGALRNATSFIVMFLLFLMTFAFKHLALQQDTSAGVWSNPVEFEENPRVG